ncbi:MAG: hypothetical protein ABEI53_01240, partial [Candidatus Magasanikbacteria bacterium]
ADLDRVADGDNISIYYELGTSSGDASSTTETAEFDSTDIEAGNSGSSVAADTMVYGGFSDSASSDGNINFIWSDDSASSHDTNTSDWFNGYRVNQPESTLSDITHTKN